MPGDPLTALRAAVEAAAADVGRSGIAPTLERPRKAGHGDYSTNAAMLLAGGAGRPPRDVAADLGERLRERLGGELASVEVAGPGFLNLVMADAWYAAALGEVLAAGDSWGGGGAAVRERVDVEFVSANPTGPVHVGHARNAAYGDAVCRVLAFHGHDVTREFYVNDFGSQIVRFGESILARARGEEVPEDGYRGEYVDDLVHLADRGDAVEVGRAAVDESLAAVRASLERFGVEPFHAWTSERDLHEAGRVAEALEAIESAGEAYRSDGALWLRTTARGDDKDRVVMRSSGEHTYFASDLGYFLDKQERGFERMLLVLGADHHGYRGRMAAAFAALGGDPERLELLIMQLVHLVSRGERASMSKRRGEFVTLDDLVEEIGADAARWFLLARSHDTTIELDLEAAKEQSPENPVYYVQYAHARIASVIDKAGGAPESVPAPPATLEPAERALVRRLLSFPEEVADAADRRAPHRIAAYALELAQEFTAFYRDCRVVGAEPEGVEAFRLALCRATKGAVARSLGLLGVSAPETM